MLAEMELIHHIQKFTKDIEFLYDQSFVKFWVYLVKFPVFIEAVDSFLQNIRKYNDVVKLQIDLDQSFNDSRLISSGEDVQKTLRRTVNRAMKIVFKLFQRMSNNMEGGQDYFSAEFYKKMLYDYQLVDFAKLLDIAAIYGQSNHKHVKTLISNILEIEPKLLIDLKDSFDMMLNIMKRIFKDTLRTEQMLKGDAILQKTRSEQDEIIYRLVQNIIEMLGNFQLITHHFGELTMEQISNTNFMVYICNTYCILRKVKKFWLKDCQTEKIKAGIETTAQIGIKLCIDIMSDVIAGILSRVGQHSKNFAMVQNKLGQTLKQFILTITGNADLSKDVLHK